jgi:hypothetical protein
LQKIEASITLTDGASGVLGRETQGKKQARQLRGPSKTTKTKMDQQKAAIKIQAFFRAKRTLWRYKEYQMCHMYRAYIDSDDPLGLWSPLEYIWPEDEGHYDCYEDEYAVIHEEDSRGEWSEDESEQDDFRPCAECGADIDGSSYETWGYCSRSCAITQH